MKKTGLIACAVRKVAGAMALKQSPPLWGMVTVMT